MVKNNNMNIVSGKINLMKLLSELELILDFEFHDKNIKNLTCQTKFTHTLYVRLLEKPIIIYVKKDSLPSITPPINNVNYAIIMHGKDRWKKTNTKRAVR